MFARLLRGIGANAFSQLVIIGLQLALVPVLATHWGLKLYGVWLMLFTIPSYLALGDFGFATAAGVDMTMKVARGDRAGTLVTYHSALAAITFVSTSVFLVALLVCALLPGHWLNFGIGVSPGAIRITLVLIVAYGLICLASSLLMAGFRCSGLYATGVMGQSVTQLAEGFACIVTVLLGGSLLAAATAYVATRTVCVVGQALMLTFQVPWLRLGYRGANLDEIKRLAKPAAAALALPFAQAVFLQGTPVVLGAATGAATVPVFTTVRTLIRAGVQFTTLLNHALMPGILDRRGAQRRAAAALFLPRDAGHGRSYSSARRLRSPRLRAEDRRALDARHRASALRSYRRHDRCDAGQRHVAPRVEPDPRRQPARRAIPTPISLRRSPASR